MDPFQLDSVSVRILTDIFERSLHDKSFVDADSYRVDHRDNRPLITRLEDRRFIMREGPEKKQYRVSLAGLIAINSDNSKIEINRCADIFKIMQSHYLNPATRRNKKHFSEIAKETRLPDHQVRQAVMYLLDSQSLWMAGASSDLAPPDVAYVIPNERVLDFENFDDVLHQVAQWHIPSSTPPLIATQNSDQTQRLLRLMEEIRAGKRTYSPVSQNSQDIEDFQNVARDLDWLHRQAYLHGFKAFRDSQTGAQRFAIVQVGDLTFEGLLYLKQITQASLSSSTPDVSATSTGSHHMLVFISWSGNLSHQIALALRDWLPIPLPSIEPWVSSEDIAKGERWTPEMANALNKANYGIVCVVRENCLEPWISFEAGAISKQTNSRLSPFLFGLNPRELGKHPLAQFQCTSYDKNEVKKLLYSLNEANTANRVPEAKLDKAFEVCWPGFQAKLDSLGSDPEKKRPAVHREEKSPGAPENNKLDENHVTILKLFIDVGDNRVPLEYIAGKLGWHIHKTRHFVDWLEKREFIYAIHSMYEPSTYGLGEQGAAYLVEQNLI